MTTDYQTLINYYVESYGEKNRFLIDRAHSIEFITSLHFLKKHLPKGCLVLDCCAAGGAYAFPLAKEGYRVTAGDLVKEHVDILREEDREGILSNIYQGDVLDMSRFEDKAFDAVLCMGALYHLQDKADRERCVSECLRVLKDTGIFVFTYINRNSVYINHFKNNISDVENQEQILKTGRNGVFYTMDFNEAKELADSFGLTTITDVGVDGLIYPLYERINSCSDEEFDSYLNYHIKACEQPSILGHSMHGLWIGKKGII